MVDICLNIDVGLRCDGVVAGKGGINLVGTTRQSTCGVRMSGRLVLANRFFFGYASLRSDADLSLTSCYLYRVWSGEPMPPGDEAEPHGLATYCPPSREASR